MGALDVPACPCFTELFADATPAVSLGRTKRLDRQTIMAVADRSGDDEIGLESV